MGDGFTADGLRGDGLADARLDRAGAACRDVADLLAAGRVRGAGAATSATSPTPTTIGLGDSFVGGFLAALDRR